MFTPGNVILGLKIGVSAVTVLLIASGTAIALGRVRLHGRINIVFFILTTLTVVGFEFIIRFVNPQLTDSFSEEAKQALRIHLSFSVPSAIMLPFMLWTTRNHRKLHARLGILFALLWTGTFITGVFFLPC